MEAKELRAKSTEELTTLLGELLREQFNLRMQKGTGQLRKPDRLRQVRRDIARVHTIMNQKTQGRAA